MNSRAAKRLPIQGPTEISKKRILRPFICPAVLIRNLPKAAIFFLLLLLLTGGASVEAKDKLRIGTLEHVVLLPWGVQLPARIDTGAATSSLDARNLMIKGNTAEFNLPPQYGGRQISLPILKWKTVKSATATVRRPVVVVEMCIGDRRIRTQVNLIDRSSVKYSLLIGRNTLMRDFVVECNTTYCTKPSCPEVSPK
jgi:hypothetical protein